MPDRQTSANRGYGYRWQQARAGYLRSHPLCVECEKHGRHTAATVVDHIVPHKGDQAQFWDRSNWQSLCQHCHDAHKARLERGGRVVGCDANGIPLDPNNHWRKRMGGGV